LTVRAGSRVEHERHDSLEEAMQALQARLIPLRAQPPRGTVRAFAREIEPVRQVVARLQLGRGRTHAGIDVRGDGSLEAWSGLVRKRVLDGEPVDALRRSLGMAEL
jgi:hypothetical protein